MFLLLRLSVILAFFFWGSSAFSANIYVPDSAFRAYLQANYAACMVGDSINAGCSQVINATTLDISNQGIANLTGVDAFKNLKELYVFNNPITAIQSQGLDSLKILNAAKCALTSADLTIFPRLQIVYLNNNQLTALQFQGLSKLKEIYFDLNQIASLNLSGLPNLEILNGAYNQISVLDLSGLTNLKNLIVGFNQLSSLNLSALANLEELRCGGNQLTVLDLTGLSKLKVVRCYFNQLEQLIFTPTAALQELQVYNNRLSFSDLIDYASLSTVAFQYAPQSPVLPPIPDVLLNAQETLTLNAPDQTANNTYQWFKNGNSLQDGGKVSGANSATLVVTNCFSGDGGDYFCKISNSLLSSLSVDSDSSHVTIDPQPAQWVSVPDSAFYAFLTQHYPTCVDILSRPNQFKMNCSAAMPVRYLNLRGLGIADLSGISAFPLLDSLDCRDNSLVFDDLEALPVLTKLFLYAPQDSIDGVNKLGLYTGSTDSILTKAGGSQNKYQWLKNAQPLSNGAQFDGVTAPVLTLKDFSSALVGAYTCRVTSTVTSPNNLSQLTLYRKQIILSLKDTVQNRNDREIQASVYPNPATETLFVRLQDNEKQIRYQLTDLYGNLIIDGRSEQTMFTFGVTHLPKGLYVLTVTTENGRMAQKISVGGN